jgi:hypothetical protein
MELICVSDPCSHTCAKMLLNLLEAMAPSGKVVKRGEQKVKEAQRLRLQAGRRRQRAE